MTGKGVATLFAVILILGSLMVVFHLKMSQDLRAYEQTEEGCEYLTAARDIDNTYFYKCGNVVIMKEVK